MAQGAGEGAAARALGGEKVSRIVEAMRKCVAARGIAGATFEHVAKEAGVSRGLLHYYFGTKERLLIEVLRREVDQLITNLDAALEAPRTADEVITVLSSGAEAVVAEDPGFYVILFELFVASRRNAEIGAELAQLYRRSRASVAEALRRKETEGVLDLRFDAETCVSYMFAAADGAALQRLTDDELDVSGMFAAGTAVARFLLTSD